MLVQNNTHTPRHEHNKAMEKWLRECTCTGKNNQNILLQISVPACSDPFIQYITIHSHFQPCIHPYAFCYLFKACRAQIMSLQPTQEGDVLYTVFSYSRAPRAYNVNFTSASPACEVSSWTYQKCGGQWLPYNPSKSSPRLSLQYSSSDAWFQLKV